MRAYHYTNNEAFESMLTGCDYGLRGLQPIHRFVKFEWSGLAQNKAHDGVVEALLEPEPAAWKSDLRYFNQWYCFMHDICKRSQVVLLSFNITPRDKAYVVNRGIIEDVLHANISGDEIPLLQKAAKKYYDSRIPALKYSGQYDLAQLAIWSPISINRLRIEWVMSASDLWGEAIENKASIDARLRNKDKK